VPTNQYITRCELTSCNSNMHINYGMFYLHLENYLCELVKKKIALVSIKWLPMSIVAVTKLVMVSTWLNIYILVLLAFLC